MAGRHVRAARERLDVERLRVLPVNPVAHTAEPHEVSQVLRRGDLSVTEVCFAVGCSSLGTFSTRFTELAGVSPSVYRRRAAGATAGMPSCVAKQVTRPIRNREASAGSLSRYS